MLLHCVKPSDLFFFFCWKEIGIMDIIPSENSHTNEQYLKQYRNMGSICALGRPGKNVYKHFNTDFIKEYGERPCLTKRRLMQDPDGMFPILNENE